MSSFGKLSDAQATWVLATIGGFVDAAGYASLSVVSPCLCLPAWRPALMSGMVASNVTSYVKLQGVFTSSITGNLIAATTAVTADTMVGVPMRAAVTIAFFLAGMAGTLLGLRLRVSQAWTKSAVGCALFGLELAFLLISLVAGQCYDELISATHPTTPIDHPAVVWAACLMAMSMGFHNVAAKETIANVAPTTVMTSTLVTVAGHAANTLGYWCLHHLGMQRYFFAAEADIKAYTAMQTDAGDKFWTTVRPLLCFIVGGIAGAASMKSISFWCLLVPAVLVVGLMVDLFRPIVLDVGAASAASTGTGVIHAARLFFFFVLRRPVNVDSPGF